MSNYVNVSGGPRRLQTREGRRILAILDRKAGASSGNRAGEDEGAAVAYEDGGRPFFADGHADFNISHSGRMVTVTYVRKTEEAVPFLRTGCDVQQADTRRNRDEIIRRFYHSEERRYVEASPDPLERNLRFFRLWVLKEAYLKLKGFSVGDIAKTPVFFPEGETPGFRAAEGGGTLNVYLSEWGEPPDMYMLAVCLEGSGETPGPPEVIWCSGERLPGGHWLPVLSVLPAAD
jgi:hypothetical protein